ncbi:MAG: hypothetical protein CMJ85_04315 [Planctomycetes bacterium]|nr:hypothetical protein [Planctomycetota bacterium]
MGLTSYGAPSHCLPWLEPVSSTPRRIVSGAQTGADLAALDFAMARGIECGGWVPLGRRNEDGRIDGCYPNLIEVDRPEPALRTRQNVRDSDGTLILSHGALTGGSRLTACIARELGRPLLHLDLSTMTYEEACAGLVRWMEADTVRVLNVAGPRHSRDPEIYERTIAVLEAAFATQSG